MELFDNLTKLLGVDCSSLTAEYRRAMPQAGAPYRLPVPEGGVPLVDLVEFANVVLSDRSWVEGIPKELPLLYSVYLTRLEVDPLRLGFDSLSFEVTELNATVTHSGAPLNFTTGSIAGHAKLQIGGGHSPKQIGIDLAASHSGPDTGWDLSGEIEPQSPALTMADVADGFGHTFGLGADFRQHIPSPIADWTLKDFAFRLNSRTKDVTYSCPGKIHDVDIAFNVNLTRTPAGPYDKHFDGTLLIGSGDDQLEFDLIFDSGSTGNTFLGVYKNPGGGALSLQTLVEAVGGSLTGAPSFKIKDVLLAYQSGTPHGKYLFALDMDVGIDLSGLGNLPLIGSGTLKTKLEEHFRSERFRKLLPYIEMSVEPPQVDISHLDRVGGIEVIVGAIGAQLN